MRAVISEGCGRDSTRQIKLVELDGDSHLHTSKILKFDSHSFEAKMITDEDGWNLIFVVDEIQK